MKPVCLQSSKHIFEEMWIAESLNELDTDGNIYLAFLTVLNMIVETGSGSDVSQITGHGSVFNNNHKDKYTSIW